MTILVVAATMTTAWAVTGSESDVQERGASFDVANLTAPPSATAGETVTVNATVSYEPDNATTATPDEATATDGEATATDGEATATDGEATATDGEATGTATETEAAGTETPSAAPNVTTTAPNETATGTASEAVTQTVEFRVAGDVVDRQQVTLAPGESTTVTFEFDTTGVVPGVYIHGIYTEDFGEVAALMVSQGTTETPTETTPEPNVTETPTATPTATPMEPTETQTPTPEEPSFDVRNLTSPDTVIQGETVTATAEVFYPIDAAGDTADANLTQSVDFRVDGDVVDRQNVTLAPGESTTVTFELDTSEVEPGIYFHSVFTRDFGEVAVLTVTSEETPPEPNVTETPTEATPTETPGTEAGTGTPTGTETGGTNETAAETATATGTETG